MGPAFQAAAGLLPGVLRVRPPANRRNKARPPHVKLLWRKTTFLALFACVFASVAGAPLAAQWLKQPTPGIPRNANGRPNLSAPAPRTPDGRPDLSGLWRRPSLKYAFNIAVDLKPGDVAPWAEALSNQRSEDLAKDHMSILCLPSGPAYATSADMAKFVQTPSLIAILHADLTYRQIFMDGDRKSTRLNSSHSRASRMPSSA